MKFTADLAELAEAVKWVAGAISPKPSQPALGGLQVTVNPGNEELVLTAHNFDQVHTARLHVESDEGGSVVPAGLMVNAILGALRTKQVTVSADVRRLAVDTRLSIAAGRSKYGVNLYTPGTWPEFPVSAVEARGAVDADDLRAALRSVGASADDDNPAQSIQGIRLEANGHELSLIATDRISLATAEIAMAGVDVAMGKCYFDARLPIKHLVAAASGLNGNVEVSTSAGLLQLSDSARSVTLRLYDGEYPAWRRLLERTNPVEVQVDAEDFRDAVKRAALTGGKDAVVAITIDSGTATITGAGEDADGTEVIDVDGDGSVSGSWAVDVLGSVLATLPSTPVTLSFETTGNGASVLAIGDKAGSFHHVVMGRRAS